MCSIQKSKQLKIMEKLKFLHRGKELMKKTEETYQVGNIAGRVRIGK
jgi:hypothetical protein